MSHWLDLRDTTSAWNGLIWNVHDGEAALFDVVRVTMSRRGTVRGSIDDSCWFIIQTAFAVVFVTRSLNISRVDANRKPANCS